MNIKFNLVKLEKTLLFQITDQTDFLISKKWISYTISNNDNLVKVSSHQHPNIYISMSGGRRNMEICLRGTDESRNEDIIVKKFDSNEERDEVYDLIIKSIKDTYVSVDDWS